MMKRKYNYYEEDSRWVCGYCGEKFNEKNRVSVHCSQEHRDEVENNSTTSLKDTSRIVMNPKEAKEKYKIYLEKAKERKEKEYEQLKNVYRHLSKGEEVIDIFEVFRKVKLDEDDNPTIAIAPAKLDEITIYKNRSGSARFDDGRGSKAQVRLPDGTFDFETQEEQTKWGSRERLAKQSIATTKVPVIPAMFVPDSQSLDGYYILFEVDQWNVPPEQKDPFLLKRINENTFVVLAEWDVTKEELAVVRGK